ncbi:MAG: extracellular solute-binding protein [Chloroflexi bacterium]|nr:extracellular solute-binding protein [Chloroflexota bacterium]
MPDDSHESKFDMTDAASTVKPMTRRRFLTLAGTASAAAVLAACSPGGSAPAGGPTNAPQVSTGGGDLNFLTWTNFVPEMDKSLDELAKKWGDQNKVKVTVEHININDIPTRRAAAVQAKSGPDLIFDTQNWPQLFADSLVDVSDIMTDMDKSLGGVHEATKAFDVVGGVWKAVPNAFGGNAFVYRTDWFKQNGVSVPKTWDEFMKAAAVMKKAGKPFGQSLGHSFGDPPSFWYPWLWAWGGKEVETDGKTVALDSPEALTAVEKAVELYKTGLVEAGLAWDDTSNNRAYAAEEISCTINGPSIYINAGRAAATDANAKRVYENSDHFLHPAGPKGVFSLVGPYSIGLMNYSKNQKAAKDFLLWLHQPDQYNAWLESGGGYLQGTFKKYDDAPVFKNNPKMKPYGDLLSSGSIKWVGWPGPLSAAAFRAYNNYTVVDLFAKACAGEYTPKAAIAWAVGQLKNVYK